MSFVFSHYIAIYMQYTLHKQYSVGKRNPTCLSVTTDLLQGFGDTGVFPCSHCARWHSNNSSYLPKQANNPTPNLFLTMKKVSFVFQCVFRCGEWVWAYSLHAGFIFSPDFIWIKYEKNYMKPNGPNKHWEQEKIRENRVLLDFYTTVILFTI